MKGRSMFVFPPVQLIVSKGMRGKRELLLFSELWPSGYYKYRQLEIITTSFLFSSESWHAEIWASGFVFRSLAGVFRIFSYKEV